MDRHLVVTVLFAFSAAFKKSSLPPASFFAQTAPSARSAYRNSLLLHAVVLLFLPMSTKLLAGAIVAVMLWVAAVQMTVPAQQYYLISLPPHSSQVALSINTSVFQLGLALGAGLGGVIVNHAAIWHISWVGGLFVLAGFGFALASFAQPKEARKAKSA